MHEQSLSASIISGDALRFGGWGKEVVSEPLSVDWGASGTLIGKDGESSVTKCACGGRGEFVLSKVGRVWGLT